MKRKGKRDVFGKGFRRENCKSGGTFPPKKVAKLGREFFSAKGEREKGGEMCVLEWKKKAGVESPHKKNSKRMSSLSRTPPERVKL